MSKVKMPSGQGCDGRIGGQIAGTAPRAHGTDMSRAWRAPTEGEPESTVVGAGHAREKGPCPVRAL
jgi:hypothetical protein